MSDQQGETTTGDTEPSAADLEAENERLREQLAQENQDLRAAILKTQQAQPTEGLTDEDVRRLEHPEEFTD